MLRFSIGIHQLLFYIYEIKNMESDWNSFHMLEPSLFVDLTPNTHDITESVEQQIYTEYLNMDRNTVGTTVQMASAGNNFYYDTICLKQEQSDSSYDICTDLVDHQNYNVGTHWSYYNNNYTPENSCQQLSHSYVTDITDNGNFMATTNRDICQESKYSFELPPYSNFNQPEPHRRKPGRKKGQISKVYHLWEFIRDLLKSPNHRHLITWEDRDKGIFRMIKSGEVAKLWGQKKKNKLAMNYEKMSRSLRYSRKEGYFMEIPRDGSYPKKLCFRFGPKSHGWK